MNDNNTPTPNPEVDPKMVELRKLLSALKALLSSVERAYHTGMINEGAAKMMGKTYNALHNRIKELLPDDFYIVDALSLDLSEASNAEDMVMQVQLAVNQLYAYLKEQVKQEAKVNFMNMDEGDMRELKDLGRSLQEQIMQTTRKALKRALSSVEDAEGGIPPIPPIPPVPPVPPVPPMPPKRKIEIEIDDE